LLLAQISDLHVTVAGTRLFGKVDSAGHLTRAVAHLNALDPRPDFIIVTGDLVDRGTLSEYEHLRHLLGRLEMPCALIPGNTDHRANLRQIFADIPICHDPASSCSTLSTSGRCA